MTENKTSLNEMVFVPAELLSKLTVSAEADDNFQRCEQCGAWFYADEEGFTTVDDLIGCWWMATGRTTDVKTCVKSDEFRMVGAYTMGPRGNPHV